MTDIRIAKWRACPPYPACEGPDMGWHVRTDDDYEAIVCECADQGTAESIASDHNTMLSQLAMQGAVEAAALDFELSAGCSTDSEGYAEAMRIAAARLKVIAFDGRTKRLDNLGAIMRHAVLREVKAEARKRDFLLPKQRDESEAMHAMRSAEMTERCRGFVSVVIDAVEREARMREEGVGPEDLAVSPEDLATMRGTDR